MMGQAGVRPQLNLPKHTKIIQRLERLAAKPNQNRQPPKETMAKEVPAETVAPKKAEMEINLPLPLDIDISTKLS